MLLACYSHKHISYRIRTIIRKAILVRRKWTATYLPRSLTKFLLVPSIGIAIFIFNKIIVLCSFDVY
ncbi:hypothetical protein [Wolbachia endosymbiont (group A) of Pherbina coryleti]|uniref:hypothetical protein n=1 Tax=Wolbachia endosymbiont (group A) of Pherbina coryleti TaxID=3066153 RepID=UPI003132D365